MRHFILTALFICATVQIAAGQGEATSEDADAFTSENAIVDTAIPFAIGAREARQELRSAFGWPTFQEGLVEGVYFRFDPDGYARFAPTPRLDTDVFEVICRPGTLNCLGRKGTMAVYLNGQGAIQLQLEDVGEGDSFFIVEGVSELPLPRDILMPLEDRLETLLGTGGELVIRRGQQEVTRLSLSGFSAVTAYLRWITARQDYAVLPRGWPVPNSSVPNGDPIAVNWQTPQRVPTGGAPQTAAVSALSDATAEDVAEVRGELNVLRDLLVSRNTEGTGAHYEQQQSTDHATAQLARTQSASPQVTALQQQVNQLMLEIEQLRQPFQPEPQTGRALALAHEVPVEDPPLLARPDHNQRSPGKMAAQLEYLMTELGLDAQTALAIVQGQNSPTESASQTAGTPSAEALPETDGVVLDILNELRTQLPTQVGTAEDSVEAREMKSETGMETEEYILLTDYFQSVFER